ncbi:flagellar protein FlgN [Litchfieldia alkalitelluris]|uniref:flagellar protein FlgN n=1 Tax=Litchfieldia alkalitelluris TaxID=304268 RepID=UPI0009976AC0|nr:flagellar protein FlgN [Litchfieldia alkalitelluris]
MSTTIIIDLLRKLYTLHSALNQLALKKTDILKNGDIPALDEHLKEEQKYILAIRQLENERVERMKLEFQRFGINGEQTLSSYIECINEPEKSKLTELQHQLVEEMLKLKQQNELNQQLTSQSLQSINMTLDMILPREKDVNYGNPTGTQANKQQRRSMFDSKA